LHLRYPDAIAGLERDREISPDLFRFHESCWD
jgi:hypothetical protein